MTIPMKIIPKPDNKIGDIEVGQFSLGQLKTIANNFSQEIQNAQNGEKSSVSFIIHEIHPSPIVKDGEIFQTLEIGGTFAGTALFKRNGNIVEILKKENKVKLSIRNGHDLLAFINDSLPEKANVLAINIAQPLKPIFRNGELDGILLDVAKENKYLDLIGKQIGKEVEKYVSARRNKKIRVIVANDSICALASGLDIFKKKKFASGIVGTGLNFAIYLSANKLVNLESANFDKFPQTEIGKKINKKSSNPDMHLFEKETGGEYLYKHFNYILADNNINYPPITSTKELDEISRANIPQFSKIAQNLFRRSAQLVACQIAGISLFEKQSMNFIMGGSLFWKGKDYKKTIERTLKKLIPKYKINLVKIEDSSILGAAKLVS